MKLLLHACCAPCSGAIVEYLVGQGIAPTLYYSNSNIFPVEEYEHRRDECARYAAKWGIDFVEDEYDHAAWLAAVRGLEREPERGARCEACFRFRLSRAAAYASQHGFDTLATTLASSRWKDLRQVGRAGEEACRALSPSLSPSPSPESSRPTFLGSSRPAFLDSARPTDLGQVGRAGEEACTAAGQAGESGAEACTAHTTVEFWDRNWRKGGLQERRNAIIKEENFYNQTYCGCEFGGRARTGDCTEAGEACTAERR